jgi:biopolymer transport protein ExbB/TolQ
MYIDQNSFSVVMEDFVDILMDYDIVCEGFVDSAKNMISRIIDVLIKLFKQTFDTIKRIFKRKPKKADDFEEFCKEMLKDLERRENEIKKNMEKGKKIDEEIDAQMDEFIKNGPSIVVYNWNLTQLPQAFEAAFNMFNFDILLYSMLPEYSKAIQNDGSTFINGIKDRILEIYDKFDEGLESIDYDAFVGKPEKVKLDTATAEGLKQVKHFTTIASVIQKVEKVVEGREDKILKQLSLFKNEVNNINLAGDFTNGDVAIKQDITRTMTKIMTNVNKNTTKSLKFLTGLINQLNIDFNKIVSSFIKA